MTSLDAPREGEREGDYVSAMRRERLSKSIGIIITNRCNAECDFCCNNSGPTKSTHLPLATVLSIIEQAHKLNFSQICFTGGEPLLHLKDIIKAGEYSNSLGMTMTINTNGFFGSNTKQTRSIISTLKDIGLVKLNLSYDDSHKKWIKAESIQTIIRCCKDLGVKVHLTCAYYVDGSRLQDFFSSDDLNGIEISESPVQFSGRAESIQNEMLLNSPAIPTDICPAPLDMVINFDGNIYPCCSVSGFTDAILLGNIYSTSLNTSIHKAINSNYLYYIQKRGLSDFFEKSPTSKSLITKAHSVCDLCKIACSSKPTHGRVLRFIDQEFASYAKQTLDKIFDINVPHQNHDDK